MEWFSVPCLLALTNLRRDMESEHCCAFFILFYFIGEGGKAGQWRMGHTKKNEGKALYIAI